MLQGNLFDLLVEKIVSEVIKKINAQPKRALVFFTGGAIGFQEAMDSLKKLDENWQLKVVLSDDAMKVLDPEAIKRELKLETIYHSKNIKSQKDLYGSVDLMIVGTLSINTAAKLACGITDTVLLSLINHGFMAGLPLIAANNACDPDDPRRIALGMGKSTKAYRKMLISNMDKLVDFGMSLVKAKDLHLACTQNLAQGPSEKKVEKISRSGEIVLAKKVISRSDILNARDASIIKIPFDAIVTEYAIEAIDSFALQMIRI